MTIRPLQLAYYKGMGGKWGAVQFNVQAPHFYLKNNPKIKNFEGKFITQQMKQHPEWKQEYTEGDLVAREGTLFLEITSTKGKNEYDWDRKVVIALSVMDMGKLLTVLEGLTPEVKLMHDPGAGTTGQGKVQKTLSVVSPNGPSEGVIIDASEKRAGEDDVRKHKVPLDAAEARVLAVCLRSQIAGALAW